MSTAPAPGPNTVTAGDIRNVSDFTSNNNTARIVAFVPERVIPLSSNDFDLTPEGSYITLKRTPKNAGCMLVLFYIENKESLDLARVWALMAEQTPGPKFGAINMLQETDVAQAFTTLGTLGASSLHWASLRQFPFILVYRDYIPVAGYNGEMAVQPLQDFALNLACLAGYYEPFQLAGGARANKTAADAASPAPYNENERRRQSSQFRSDNAVRQYLQPGQAAPTPGNPPPPSVNAPGVAQRPGITPSGQGLSGRVAGGGAGGNLPRSSQSTTATPFDQNG